MQFFVPTGDWILALGKTILHSIWIGLLILSFLNLALNVIPDKYANLRYRISLLSMFLLLGSGISLFILLYSPSNTALPIHGLSEVSVFFSGLVKAQMPKSEISILHVIYQICSYLYFAGIPVILIRSLGLFRQQARMKNSGTRVEGSWKLRFEHLTKSLGIFRKVELMESGILTVPALVGFFRPVVLLPVGMLSNLSVNQVETILVHELHHLRRFDAIINMVQLLIENLFFYNPAVWVISKHIRTEREKCCDDRVLESCDDPLTYARALYQIAGQNKYPHLSPGAGGTDKYQLFHRIQRILKIKTMKNNIREKLFSLLLLAGGVLIMLTVTGFTSGFSIVKNNEARQFLTVNQNTESNLPSASFMDTIPEESAEVPGIDPSEEELDWEEIKKEMEEAKLEAKLAMEEIDWEEMKKEMEEAKLEAKKAMEEIDWEEIKKEMEEVKINLDSVMRNLDIDFENMEMDFEGMEFDLEGMEFDFEGMEFEFDFDFDNIEIDFESMEMNFDDLELPVDLSDV